MDKSGLRKKKGRQVEPPTGPKDTKVTLLNSEEFRKLKASEMDAGSSTSKEPPDPGLDFPSLTGANFAGTSESEMVVSRWNLRRQQKVISGASVGPIACPKPSTSKEFNAGTSRNSKSLKPLPITQLAVPTSLKRSKRPILLDFSTAMKTKRLGQEKKVMTVGIRQAKPLKMGGRIELPQPVKKGKHREWKKIKLSRLKTEIIKERISKSLSAEVNEFNLKDQIKIYLEKVKSKNDASKEARALKIDVKERPKPKQSVQSESFNKRFRSYCENVLTEELNESVREMIKSLIKLQDNAFNRDPLRARAKKRYVVGLRETGKLLKLKKLKMLIMAPDLETSSSEGALMKTINELKENAASDNVPCVFALSRRQLGYSSLRKAPVSCFAILSYEGLEEKFKEVIRNLKVARELFLNTFKDIAEESSKEEIVQDPNNLQCKETMSVIESALRALSFENKSSSSPNPEDSDENICGDPEIVEENPFLRAFEACR